jgi:hypothetical protein
MLKWFMKRKLKAFGDAFDYDTSYMQELVDVDPARQGSLSRLSAVASYRRCDAPQRVCAWWRDAGLRTLRPVGRGMAERRRSVSDLRAIIRVTLRA